MRIRTGVVLVLVAVAGLMKVSDYLSHPRSIVVFGAPGAGPVTLSASGGGTPTQLTPRLWEPTITAVERGAYEVASGGKTSSVKLGFGDYAVAVPVSDQQCFVMLDFVSCYGGGRSSKCEPKVFKRFADHQPLLVAQGVVFAERSLPTTQFTQKGKSPQAKVLRAVPCDALKQTDSALIVSALDPTSLPSAVPSEASAITPEVQKFVDAVSKQSGFEVLSIGADERRAVLRKGDEVVFLSTASTGEGALADALEAMTTPSKSDLAGTVMPLTSMAPALTYESIAREFPALYGRAATVRVPVAKAGSWGNLLFTWQLGALDGLGPIVSRDEEAVLAKAGVSLSARLEDAAKSERAAVEKCLASLPARKHVVCADKQTAGETARRLRALSAAVPAGQSVVAEVVNDQRAGTTRLVLHATNEKLPGADSNGSVPYLLRLTDGAFTAVSP